MLEPLLPKSISNPAPLADSALVVPFATVMIVSSTSNSLTFRVVVVPFTIKLPATVKSSQLTSWKLDGTVVLIVPLTVPVTLPVTLPIKSPLNVVAYTFANFLVVDPRSKLLSTVGVLSAKSTKNGVANVDA